MLLFVILAVLSSQVPRRFDLHGPKGLSAAIILVGVIGPHRDCISTPVKQDDTRKNVSPNK